MNFKFLLRISEVKMPGIVVLPYPLLLARSFKKRLSCPGAGPRLSFPMGEFVAANRFAGQVQKCTWVPLGHRDIEMIEERLTRGPSFVGGSGGHPEEKPSRQALGNVMSGDNCELASPTLVQAGAG